MLKWNVFIVLSIIICTCSSDNIGDYEDPAVCRLVQNGSEIEKIEVGKDRQTVLLTLYASSSWSLTCDAKWCKLSNKFGEATVDNPRTISITVDENTTSDIRNATVILSTAQMQKQLVISQSNHILAPNAEWETASEAVKNMRVGWCLGNTLDCSGLWLDKYTAKATDYEIGWGQPVTEFKYTVQNPSLHRARVITERILELYNNNELDEVYIIYTKMENSFSMEAEMMKLLPLVKEDFMGKAPVDIYQEEIKADTTMQDILEHVVPNYVNGFIYGALVESFASEHNSRMMAMQAATDSAKEMLQTLSIEYNRVRQAAITQQITEVIGGAKAQKKKKKK